MKISHYVGLFMVSVLVACGVAWIEKTPGYMDAEYYYSGGLRLIQGKGFSDPFIWNYLDDPAGIPNTSHTYWMPLASLVAAAGMLVTNQQNFLGARFFFILLVGIMAPITAYFAYIFSKRTKFAMLAGLLAIFSGYYLPYITDTETFSLYIFIGSLFVLVAFSDAPFFSGRLSIIRPLVLGLLSGGMHLSRADGILWLFAAIILLSERSLNEQRNKMKTPAYRFFIYFGSALIILLVGYFVVMGGWYARNMALYGSLFSPGGVKTLWLTNYDQTFIYPASQLNFHLWTSIGFGEHIRIWWNALTWNLRNTLAVQGGGFLFLLIFPGLWVLRKEKIVRFALIMWFFTLGLMTFVFPFSGSRGGFLHSASAIQPILWAAVPFGLNAFVSLGVRYRHWDAKKSWPVFAAIIVGICAILTSAIFWSRVIGSNPSEPVWSQSSRQYQEITQAINGFGESVSTRVMVNNPPGFYLESGIESLVIPDGDIPTLMAVAKRYHADYLVLEPNHVLGLKSLYQQPRSRPGLNLVKEINGNIYIYRIAIHGE